jgi:hypothetical protein
MALRVTPDYIASAPTALAHGLKRRPRGALVAEYLTLHRKVMHRLRAKPMSKDLRKAADLLRAIAVLLGR